MYKLLSILSVLIIISTVPIVSAEVIRGESTVPDWVKNTAGWWASEQIPDSAFLQGIQYLIKEGIIQIEPENHNELANAITELLTDKNKRLAYGNAGYHLVDSICNSTIMSKETLKVYEKTINR